MKLLRLLAFIINICFTFTVFAEEKIEISGEKCLDISEKKTLLGGWYIWDPYQFNKLTAAGLQLTGMDIELTRKIAEKIGVKVEYEVVSWEQHQQDLREGARDIASGATFTKARSEFVYFSEPYRFEENSLFVLWDSTKELKFNNIGEYLAQIRLQNFRLGVTEGFIYADPRINLFIADEVNKDIVLQYKNNTESLQALIRGEVDGVMADRIAGAATILNKKASSTIKEVALNIKTPIHLMFSKKTVPVELVDRLNKEIKEFTNSTEYKNIVKTYLYPVMLMQTIDSGWFYFIGVIGTIGFALSGIAIAAKDNTTLFGTFLLAMLPSVGGGVMRDLMTNRNEVEIFLTPSYMYYILIIVAVSFATIRLLEYYNGRAQEDQMMSKFLDGILVFGDAIGQAAFIITGVSIAIMARIEPVALWGPFFAFLTSNGGGILRDLIRKNHEVTITSGNINAEISIFWGLVFSLYLDVNSYNPSPTGIRNAVILVAIAAFASQLLCYYLKIPNIKFRADKVDPIETQKIMVENSNK